MFLAPKATANGIASGGIHLPHFVEDALVSSESTILGHHGHTHLNGVDPIPVLDLRGIDQHIHQSTSVSEVHCRGVQLIEVDVGLGAAVVVRIAVGVAIAEAPLVELSPLKGIVEVGLVGVDVVESHESLVVYAASPDVAGPHLLDKRWRAGVWRCFHEIGVDALGSIEHLGAEGSAGVGVLALVLGIGLNNRQGEHGECR